MLSLVRWSWFFMRGQARLEATDIATAGMNPGGRAAGEAGSARKCSVWQRRRGARRFCPTQSVCVKCSTQERRWGSPSANAGRRSEGDTGDCGRRRAEAGIGRPLLGATAGPGVWGLGGEEDGAESDLKPMVARSAGCAGCADGTAWGGLVRKDAVVPCPWARVRGGGKALTLEIQPPLLSGRNHSRRWRGECKRRRRRDGGSAKRLGP